MENQEKKTQKKSVSYATKALGNHLRTLVEANVITVLEYQKMQEMQTTILERVMKKEFGLTDEYIEVEPNKEKKGGK